jgi:ubiquinone/menaquinone biosynthesis C-methylase UbiE
MNWKILFISFLEPFRKISEHPLERLVEVGLEDGMAFLDVGCALGFYSFYASSIVGEKGLVYALDLNPEFIGYVAKKSRRKGVTNIKPIVTSAQETGLPSESVDVAFLHLVLHDIEDKSVAMKEFYRVLRKSGRLVVDEEDVTSLSLVREIAEKSGFRFLKRLRKTIQIFEKAEN